MQRLAGISLNHSDRWVGSMGRQWRGVEAGEGLICLKSVRCERMHQTLEQQDALEGEDLQGIQIQKTR